MIPSSTTYVRRVLPLVEIVVNPGDIFLDANEGRYWFARPAAPALSAND